jgi:hypothetical protein
MLKRILMFLLMGFLSLQAIEITPETTARLANDSYDEVEKFIRSYKGEITKDDVDSVRYYRIETDDIVVLVFRGTSNTDNFVTDVDIVDTEFLDLGIYVHGGFYDIAKKVDSRAKIDKKKTVYLVGHSLGGAVALLYGALLSEKGYKVNVYTFGMPPSADHKFVKLYKDKIHHERFYHVFDPVPMLHTPSISTISRQLNLKAFFNSRRSISDIILSIKNTPLTFQHHGTEHKLTTEVYQSEEDKKRSLFFKTLTRPLAYHSISNYIYALSKQENMFELLEEGSEKSGTNSVAEFKTGIDIIPSITEGTNPLDVDFYIETNGQEVLSYYFKFDKREFVKDKLDKNLMSYRFEKSGVHKVVIAVKTKDGITRKEFEIKTRFPTWEEYQEQISKDFLKYKKANKLPTN